MIPLFAEILEMEGETLVYIHERLVDFGNEADGQALEAIYSSFCSAYAAGQAAFDALEARLTHYSFLAEGHLARMTPQERQIIQGLPQDRIFSAFLSLGLLEALVGRPVDAFRDALRGTQRAVMEHLRAMVGNPQEPAQTVQRRIEQIGSLLLHFEDGSEGIYKRSQGELYAALKGAAAGFVLGGESGFSLSSLFGGAG